MKVLIVDDSKATLNLVEGTLTAAGYEVIQALDGKDAWEIINQDHIRLVITDWDMPRMDGIELCKKIRSADIPGYVYIILLTSHDRKQDVLMGLSAGTDDYISKPFDQSELKLRLQIGARILSLETRDVTIFALAKLAESRDNETGLHLERMRNYSKILACALGELKRYKNIITPQYIQNIYLTSPMHDIGKVGIPDSVLLKPDKLTAEEWAIMKTHAEKGAETLGAALDEFPGIAFLKIAQDIAWCHHEKYDGSGYPRGLKGEEIPLGGRIVALADAYDAITSKRVYKEASSCAEARWIIEEESGRHFDPDTVQAFLTHESSFMKIYKDLSEDKSLSTTKSPAALI
jgi:putative two-component system response regulator